MFSLPFNIFSYNALYNFLYNPLYILHSYPLMKLLCIPYAAFTGADFVFEANTCVRLFIWALGLVGPIHLGPVGPIHLGPGPGPIWAHSFGS